jgi:hypothetical protein
MTIENFPLLLCFFPYRSDSQNQGNYPTSPEQGNLPSEGSPKGSPRQVDPGSNRAEDCGAEKKLSHPFTLTCLFFTLLGEWETFDCYCAQGGQPNAGQNFSPCGVG